MSLKIERPIYHFIDFPHKNKQYKMKVKFKVGDKVQTIQGVKTVTGVKKDVVIFSDGFAPRDRVIKLYV